MINHDRLFKELLTTFFVEFIELFIPDMMDYLDKESITFMDKEIFTDVAFGGTHIVDLLVCARFRGMTSCFLVHTEPQARRETEFPFRMFQYFARIHERLKLPVYPIALLSFKTPKSAQPSSYELTFPNKHILTFHYTVIQTNRLDWRNYAKTQNPVAAALMSRMKIAPDDYWRVKLECLRMIAQLKLDPAKTRLLSRIVDVYLKLDQPELEKFEEELQNLGKQEQEDVMEIITSWMEEGIQKGLEQGIKQGIEQGIEKGIEQGIEQGRREGKEALLIRQLTRRFGKLESPVVREVKSLSADKIERLAEDLLDFERLLDLECWLAKVQ